MDSPKISNIFREYHRNKIKWVTSSEDTRTKKVRLPLAKYSIEELEYLLHQLLNEGELVINWGRNLKNKGDAVITV